MIQIKHSKIR